MQNSINLNDSVYDEEMQNVNTINQYRPMGPRYQVPPLERTTHRNSLEALVMNAFTHKS